MYGNTHHEESLQRYRFTALCRFITIVCACLCVLVNSPLIAHASAKVPLSINAKGAVVYDATSGKVLFDKHADTPMYPASTTKLMTAILLVTYLQPDEQIYISQKAAHQPKVRLGIASGKTMSADEALHALLMKSSNDVALAIAETIGGSQAGFARMMNIKASLLGCTHTNFVTPNGLHDDEHMSSAHDLAIILGEAVKHPRIVDAMQTQEATAFGKPIRNGNRLIYTSKSSFGEIIGGKTGYTSKAMYCLAFAANQHGHVRVSVVLGAPRKSAMYRETRRLLEWSLKQPVS